MLRMMSKRVAVRPDRKEEVTEGGIIIPETVVAGREQGHLNEGEVVAVATDVDGIVVGNRVLYVEGTYWKNNKRVNADEVEIEGEDLIMLLEREVVAVIE